MTNVPSTPEAIEWGLNETFPQLAPQRVIGVLGSGFNSIAIETEDGLIFRVAKTPGTAERYAREACLLPIVRRHLPVAVPEPRWLVERSPLFPHGVTGYEKLAGRVVSPALLRPERTPQLAEQTAEALLALHRVSLGEIASCTVARPEDNPAAYRMVRRETTPALRCHLTVDEFARIERWWDAFLTDERISQFDPVLAHNDFWYENMLLDDNGTLVGIVDWEYAALSDLAVDFSFHLGPEFRAHVVEAYRHSGGRFGPEEEHRMRRLWELREFYGVLHSVRFGDDTGLLDSIRKLRSGPIFDAS